MKEFNPEMPENNSFAEQDIASTEGGYNFKQGYELENAIFDTLINQVPTDKIEKFLLIINAMCVTWNIKLEVNKSGTLIVTDEETGKIETVYPEELYKEG